VVVLQIQLEVQVVEVVLLEDLQQQILEEQETHHQ
jgi:hypothetical protein